MFPPCHEDMQLIVKMCRYVATSTGDPAFFHFAHCHEGANYLSVYGEYNLISLGVCIHNQPFGQQFISAAVTPVTTHMQ